MSIEPLSTILAWCLGITGIIVCTIWSLTCILWFVTLIIDKFQK